MQPLPVFGSSLAAVLARWSHMTSEGYLIPAILAVCFQEIEQRGLEIEGLFRKSGSTATVNRLQVEFEQCQDNPFLIKFPCTVSSHSLAGLFKRYLQLLPEPVIPKHCQKQFLEAYDENVEKEILKERLKQLCKSLPHEHLHLFQFLVSVADKIQRNQEKNQMTIEALAIIFAPTCIRIDSMSSNTTLQDTSNTAMTTNTATTKPLLFQKARQFLFMKRKRPSPEICYQDVLQLDLIKESIKWTKLFEFILEDPKVFANLTNQKIKSPSIPIMIEKTALPSSRSTIDSTSFWNVPIDTTKLEFKASHEIIKNFESFNLDIQLLGPNEKQTFIKK